MKVHPNLIIPGFPKSGTSSLYHYLSQHPDIDGIKGKEPHVFSKKRQFERREEVFRRQFDTSMRFKYRMEASTTYMITPEAPERIERTVPGPKLIIIARDPIERVFSHFNWLWCMGQIENDFRTEILKWEEKPYHPDVHFGGNYKNYVAFSRYGEQFQRYRDVFKRDQILYLTTESLKASTESVLHKCFDFLNLDPIEGIDTRRQNVTKKNEVVTAPNFLIRLRQALPDVLFSLPAVEYVKKWFTKTYEPKVFGVEEEQLVYDLMEDDIRLQESLGLLSDEWKTTQKYL